MAKYIITSFLLCLGFLLQAQKVSTKEISVNVEEDNGKRMIKVIASENGDDKVYEWTDNGEIPDDIKKQLSEDGIDISILGSDGDEGEVEVQVTSNGVETTKEVVIIKEVREDGEVIEWDGEGEMPEEMEEILEEYEIEIGEVEDARSRAKSKAKDAKMKVLRKKAMREGREYNDQMNTSPEKRIRIKKIDGEEDMIWMSEDGEKSIIKIESSNEPKLSDAYMGARIQDGDDGVEVVDTEKDGPSSGVLQKGDIITRVNGARPKSMEGLLSLLNYYEPTDKLEVEIMRDGKSKTVELTLGKRPKQFRL